MLYTVKSLYPPTPLKYCGSKMYSRLYFKSADASLHTLTGHFIKVKVVSTGFGFVLYLRNCFNSSCLIQPGVLS